MPGGRRVECGAGGHSWAKEEEPHGRLPQLFPRGDLLLEDGSLGRSSGEHGVATSAALGGGARSRGGRWRETVRCKELARWGIEGGRWLAR
jgi:hypothetical protein